MVSLVSAQLLARLLVTGTLIAAVAAVALQPGERYDRATLQALRASDAELVDRRAADFERPGPSGTVRLSDLRGRAVLVNFWASWCAPCREELPSMVDLATSLDGRPFAMVAVSLDEDAEAMQRLWTSSGAARSPILLAHDPAGDLAPACGTRLLPESYLVDPDGVVVARFAGPRDWASPDIRLVIERTMLRRWRADR
jgi:thiol-disulfide isomerase/thioredoxin